MTRPRLTRMFTGEDYEPAKCPHCDAEVGFADLPLDALAEHWPLPKFVSVDHDGYAASDAGPWVECRGCGRLSAVADGEDHLKLIAMRTATDEQYLWGHAS